MTAERLAIMVLCGRMDCGRTEAHPAGGYVTYDDHAAYAAAADQRLAAVLALLRARVASGDVRACVLRDVERVACGKSPPKT